MSRQDKVLVFWVLALAAFVIPFVDFYSVPILGVILKIDATIVVLFVALALGKLVPRLNPQMFHETWREAGAVWKVVVLFAIGFGILFVMMVFPLTRILIDRSYLASAVGLLLLVLVAEIGAFRGFLKFKEGYAQRFESS